MFDIVLCNGETWVICGGRDFADQEMFDDAMGELIRLRGTPDRVIHGGARGADRMAGEWALRHLKQVTVVPADWDKHGNAAGPIRNQRMLDDYKPHFVVAFPGGRGTADMVNKGTQSKGRCG